MKKFLVSLLLLAGVSGISTSAYATNDGHLDGVWLNARIKTTIPKAIGLSSGSVFNNVPIDTGKDKCYVLLTWKGLGSSEYDMAAFCLNGNGQWEREGWNGLLFELNDGKQSVGYDWTWIYFAQENRRYVGNPPDLAYTGYEGTLILTPKLDASGNVKSIKTFANSGAIYSWDRVSEIGGTSKGSGFKLKFVKTENVPAGAIECATGNGTPLCP